ncbi:MAG TPA: type III-B CRISPR-associated protein Cas10/Cmr2 [Nitrososphaera sp.]|nr:type III-B CRISPR-associated protein Cas10/Cmr2 [Nitrososphaera sp.]
MVDKNIWNLKIGAFLHDPPDKALRIRDHVERSAGLKQRLGIVISAAEESAIAKADHIASAMQRINIPDELSGIVIEFLTSKQGMQPEAIHPLSAVKKNKLALTEYIASSPGTLYTSDKLIADEKLQQLRDSDPKKMFFKIWRFLPELEWRYSDLPADSRIPDHTIWEHLDVTSALTPAVEEGIAILSFKLSPVQEFISQARKGIDLWAGSHILSWLSFNAIIAIVEEYGPDAIIYPYLRSQPFMDWWLETEKYLNVEYDKESLLISNIPHTFVAIIPAKNAREIEQKVRNAVNKEWKDIANFALNQIVDIYGRNISEDVYFKKTWDRQISNCFSVHTAVVPWANPSEDEAQVKKWLDGMENLPGEILSKYKDWLEWNYGDLGKSEKNGRYKANAGVLYGLYYEVAGILLNTYKMKFEYMEEPAGEGKCTIDGFRNQIRPEGISARDFWSAMYKSSREKGFFWLLGENERLSAVSVTKRLYKMYIENEKKLGIEKMRIPSVAYIASKPWVEDVRDRCPELYSEFKNLTSDFDVEDEIYYIDYWENNEIDVQRKKQIHEKLQKLYKVAGEPPKYYAVLVMDGDDIGKKIRGDGLPPMRKFLHSTIEKELTGDRYDKFLDSSRILNPTIHVAISKILKDFSTRMVRRIIEDHGGVLVYAGGDDVMALLPARTAFDAARKINEKFQSDYQTIDYRGKQLEIPMMGSNSSISAGVVFAHYKYPLHDVLAAAHESLEDAKHRYGKNAFVLKSIKHSGQITAAGAKWSISEKLNEVLKQFEGNGQENRPSKRLIYDLLAPDLQIIESLGKEAVDAEIRRLVKRRYGEVVNDESIEQLSSALFGLYELMRRDAKEDNTILYNIGILLKVMTDAIGGEEK